MTAGLTPKGAEPMTGALAPRRSPRFGEHAVAAGYASGMVGLQISRDVPALLLIYFMTTDLGVSAALAGLVLTVPKIWLVVFDPLIGVVSDATKSRWGRRKPYMLAAAPLCALSFIFLFVVPPLGSELAYTLWIGTGYLLLMSAFSAFAIPHLTLASEMGTTERERSFIVAYRIAFASLGLLLAASAPMLVEYAPAGQGAYAFMALVLAPIIAGTFLLSVFAGREKQGIPSAGALSLGQLRDAFSYKPYRSLISSYFLQQSASAVSYAAIAHFVVFRLQAPLSVLTGLIVAVALGAMLAQPVWLRISGRFSKPKVYVLALAAFCVIHALWLLMDRASPAVYFLSFASGFATSGTLLMAQSMLTDTIEGRRTAEGREAGGIASGLFLASEKLAFGLGALLAGLILQFFGFAAGQDGAATVQSDLALTGIGATFVVMPILMMFGCFYLISGYDRPPASRPNVP